MVWREKFDTQTVAIILLSQIARNNTNIKWFNKFFEHEYFQIYRRATFRVKETEVVSDSPNSITG